MFVLHFHSAADDDEKDPSNQSLLVRVSGYLRIAELHKVPLNKIMLANVVLKQHKPGYAIDETRLTTRPLTDVYVLAEEKK